MQLTTEHFQRVLDHYSVGLVRASYQLEPKPLVFDDVQIPVLSALVETSHGLFVIAYGKDVEWHDFWWGVTPDVFSKRVARAVLLKYAQPLSSGTDVDGQPIVSVHKFDMRFVVFEL